MYVYARLMNLAQIVLALPAVLHESSHPAVASLGAAFVCLITGGLMSRQEASNCCSY